MGCGIIFLYAVKMCHLDWFNKKLTIARQDFPRDDAVIRSWRRTENPLTAQGFVNAGRVALVLFQDVFTVVSLCNIVCPALNS